jgi:hypothetical protein
VTEGADVDGEVRAARSFDAADDFRLDAERTHEPIQVGDNNNVGLPRFDELDGTSQSRTARERGATRHI